MRLLILAALLAGVVPSAYAQSTPPRAAPSRPEAISERLFAALGNNRIEEAVAILFDSSPLMASKKAERSELHAKLGSFIVVSGPVLAWERLGTERLGTMMRRDTFLAQHRDIVVRWRLTFARTGTGWVLAEFSRDDRQADWFR